MTRKVTRGGRPPKPVAEKLSEAITTKVTKRDRAMIDAKRGRQPLAAYMREKALS